MKNYQLKPKVYKFHSTPHLYRGLSGETDLLLEIYEYGPDALEVKLINRYLSQQKRNITQHLTLFMLTSGCCYLWLHFNIIFRLPHLEYVFTVWFALLMWKLSHLVEYEKLIYCHDFGLNLQTKRLWSKSNTFIVDSNIYDVCVNEVIENLDVRYLLIVRTRGKLFLNNPIIPVFKVFKPSCDCLGLIYQHLNKVMHKETIITPTS